MTTRSFRTIFNFIKLFPVYIFQFRPEAIKLYLYLLMPLIGLIYYIKKREYLRIFTPYLLLFLISTIVAVSSNDLSGARRSVQLIFMLGFSQFLANYFDEEELYRLAFNCLMLIAGFFIVERIWGFHFFNKVFFGHYIDGLAGAQAYSNHTGMTIAGLGLYFIAIRRHFAFILSVLLIIPTYSRIAMICMLLGTPLFFEHKISDRLFKNLCKIIILLIISSPLLIYLIEVFANTELKLFVDKITSHRYAIQLSFLEIFKDNIFGVGHDYCHNLYEVVRFKGSTIASEGLIILNDEDMGPHSTFLKILIELGIWGYTLFSLFVWNVINMGLRGDKRLTYAFICMLFGYCSLNGINEFVLFFFIAVLLKNNKDPALLNRYILTS